MRPGGRLVGLFAAVLVAGCAARPALPVDLPEPSAREWTRLRERLEITRDATPERPYTENIVVAMREPRTGKVFQARGAVAVEPGKALRMILIGPGGATALDAWVTDDHFRVVVPPISLERRGGADPEASRGLPVGFLRWWLLHPLEGRLLAAWNREGGPLYLLRHGDETVLLREARALAGRERVMAARREGRHVPGDAGAWSTPDTVERLDWLGRSPTVPHAGDKARYVDGASGLQVEVLVEGLGREEPDPAAFLDPDADPAASATKGTPL